MNMTPEKLELLRKWVQAECYQVYYKLEHEGKNDVCKKQADAAFFQVVMAFCGTD
jgi:hypothetical protein